MKKRVFREMDNAVYRIVVDTEDWSQGDVKLMEEFGEPEINVGGEIEYTFNGEIRTIELGDEYVRVMHGFPYSRGFDSRDCDDPELQMPMAKNGDEGDECCTYKLEQAVAIGNAWKEIVLGRIDDAVMCLRTKRVPLPTEEVSEI